MLLVVLGHTMYFCIWHEQPFTDPLFNAICTFHVPLFFFLSGFVISHPPTPRKFLGKARRFLVPMLVVGLINALLIDKVHDFFFNGGHNGYWYLLTLTIFYFLLIPFRLLGQKKGMRYFFFDSLLSIGIWLLLTLFSRISDLVLDALNIWGAFLFWPYFIIGYQCRKYSLTNSIKNKPLITTVLVVLYLIMLVVFFPEIDHLPLVIEYFIALLAIAALMALFYHFSDSHTFIDRQLLLIGNSTLEIYIFHYFFIRFIDLSVLQNVSRFTEYAIIVPLTIAIVYGTIGIGRIWNNYLRRILRCSI